MTTSPVSKLPPFPRARSQRGRVGFTLLELLIVIAIISLLVVISLAIGTKVLSGGRESLTTSITRSMDSTLSSYMADVGDKIPRSLVEHPSASSGIDWQPVADIRQGDGDDDNMVNSVGWYVYQMKDVSSVASTISGLPSKVVKQYSPDEDPLTSPSSSKQPLLTTVFDGWGRPLRYVHPDFDGVITDSSTSTDGGVNIADLVSIGPGESFAFNTIRRNRTTKVVSGVTIFADGDGGMCPNNRPYFYSAGADGDPSTIDDNIYSTRPTFQTE